MGSMSIEPWRNKDLLVHARTVYDAAFEAGLTTAQVDWVAIYGARTITWSFPEQPDPKGLIEGELVSAGSSPRINWLTLITAVPHGKTKSAPTPQ